MNIEGRLVGLTKRLCYWEDEPSEPPVCPTEVYLIYTPVPMPAPEWSVSVWFEQDPLWQVGPYLTATEALDAACRRIEEDAEEHRELDEEEGQ